MYVPSWMLSRPWETMTGSPTAGRMKAEGLARDSLGPMLGAAPTK